MAKKTQYYNLDKPSYDEVADIEVINANFDKIDQQMRNNADGVNFAKGISSDAYDNSKLYAVGDYCIYDNKLYRCITAIESAEAFNIAKWKQTTVGKEVKQLNSNLGQLEFGEVAGGKNILDITQNYKRYSNGVLSVSGNKITITGQWYCYYIIDVEENTDYFVSGNIDSSTVYGKCSILNEDSSTFVKDDALNKTFNSGNNKKIAVLFYCGTDTSGTSVYSNIMIEKGTVATPYEPYIPSVKMLAEDVNQQNDSLGDYGLDSIPTDLENGAIDDSGNFVSSNSNVRDKQFRNCNAGDTVTVISQTDSYWIGIACYKSDGTFISLVKTANGHHTKATFTAPTNTSKYKVVLSLYSNMTPSQVGRVVSYVNNAIDELKNDLNNTTMCSYAGNGVTVSTTDWEYHGTNITIPNGYYALVVAERKWVTGKPSGVAISFSNTENTKHSMCTQTESSQSVFSTSYIITANDNPVTVYLWSKGEVGKSGEVMFATLHKIT